MSPVRALSALTVFVNTIGKVVFGEGEVADAAFAVWDKPKADHIKRAKSVREIDKVPPPELVIAVNHRLAFLKPYEFLTFAKWSC